MKSSTERNYYPLFLDMSQKPCLVVGGGKVAERKVKMLLQFNASITLVSPAVTNTLRLLAGQKKIRITERPYRAADLSGVSLVFAATDDDKVNNKIKDDAAQRNIPVNVVDNPDLCDFIVPSIVKKDPIIIAISTSGVLPLLSKKLRKQIESLVTAEYISYARKIGIFRKFLIDNVPDKKRRSDIMKKIGKIPFRKLNSMGLREIKSMFLQKKS